MLESRYWELIKLSYSSLGQVFVHHCKSIATTIFLWNEFSLRQPYLPVATVYVPYKRDLDFVLHSVTQFVFRSHRYSHYPQLQFYE